MEAPCTMSRALGRPSLSEKSGGKSAGRGIFALTVALFGLSLSGCSIVFPPDDDDDCTPLAEICPNLECEAGFLVNEQGCAMCECADVTPEPPRGCTSDAECAPYEVCVFGDVGGPQDGGPAPLPYEPCDPSSDAPCGGDGEDAPPPPAFCEPDPNGNGCMPPYDDRPEPEDEPHERPVTGRCEPISCPAVTIICPDGYHVEYDFSDHPCGEPRCEPNGPLPNECAADSDCGPSQYCELISVCDTDCRPGPEGQDCAGTCEVFGRCVDEGPYGCMTDTDCGTGFICQLTEVCTCPGDPHDQAPPRDEPGRPAPCDLDCHAYGECVWDPGNTTCYSDGDCRSGQHCAYADNCAVPPNCPNCLVACPGVCVDNEPTSGSCFDDSDCAANERCDVINYCDPMPGCAPGEACPPVCYGRCVVDEECPEPGDAGEPGEPTDPEGPGGLEGLCLDQDDCPEGSRCATELDICICPGDAPCDVCYSRCALIEPPADDEP